MKNTIWLELTYDPQNIMIRCHLKIVIKNENNYRYVKRRIYFRQNNSAKCLLDIPESYYIIRLKVCHWGTKGDEL